MEEKRKEGRKEGRRGRGMKKKKKKKYCLWSQEKLALLSENPGSSLNLIRNKTLQKQAFGTVIAHLLARSSRHNHLEDLLRQIRVSWPSSETLSLQWFSAIL